MVKVTYNKKQLLAFTKVELATIDISQGIDMKLKKDVIVKAMLKAQKSAIEATKAQPEKTEAVAPVETVSDESTNVDEGVATQESEAPIDTVEEKDVEEVASPVKPHFHRTHKTRGPMGY